jgi:alpha-glucosidase
MKIALLAMLRGNMILYQGEELGLDQVDIPYEQVRDPEALRNWPLTLSRDGARTPMPWTATAPWCGFSTNEPWLPLGPNHAALAVDVQRADPHSTLSTIRQVLAIRRAHPALRVGRVERCTHDGMLLSFVRAHGDRAVTCLFNMGQDAREIGGRPLGGTVLLALNGATGDVLPPYGVLIVESR